MAARLVALDHSRDRRRLAKAVVAEARRLWGQVDPARIRESWLELVSRLVVVVSGAQLVAAMRAEQYLDAVLAEQGIPPIAEGVLIASSLTGIASDGLPLDTLLTQPAITSLVALDRGRTTRQALGAGRATLEMMVRTQVADAGRVADGVALTARIRSGGYVRMVVGATCSRCIILAGRFYRWNAGFQRHPNCLPADVAVSGPPFTAATRRWYEGELVVIRTASGQELPVTGNHPVLTARGWVPANLVNEGDHVARSIAGHVSPLTRRAISGPDEDHVPTLIEDLWRSGGMVSLGRMPTTAQDFHGDGGHGEVDVVVADCFLSDRFFAEFDEPIEEPAFLARNAPVEWVQGRRGLALQGHGDELVGIVRGSQDNTLSAETYLNGPPGDPMLAGEIASTLTGEIRGHDLADREFPLFLRWDAPAAPFSVDSRPIYAARGRDLLHRLVGQVELDRVVEHRRISWSGHVYNLTSIEGWYSAANIILSNCDCVHIPSNEDTAEEIRTDPKKLFASMTEAEQDKVFTKAGAQAIRDGSDISRVVNARRGMSTAAGPSGRRRLVRDERGLFTTTEAVTRRGRLPGQTRGPRLMPESVYELAGGDRDEALRLLRFHGFIL